MYVWSAGNILLGDHFNGSKEHLITSNGLYIIIIIRIMNYDVSSNGNGLLYSNGLGIIIIIRTMYYYVSLNGNGLLLSNVDYFIISIGLGNYHYYQGHVLLCIIKWKWIIIIK